MRNLPLVVEEEVGERSGRINLGQGFEGDKGRGKDLRFFF